MSWKDTELLWGPVTRLDMEGGGSLQPILTNSMAIIHDGSWHILARSRTQGGISGLWVHLSLDLDRSRRNASLGTLQAAGVTKIFKPKALCFP